MTCAAAPDGSLWLTDTGIEVDPRGRIPVGGDRIFRIGVGHAVTVVAEGDSLYEPNGITWDSARSRWVVLPFQDLLSYIFLMESSGMPRLPVVPGRGQFDGVEALPGKKLLAIWVWIQSGAWWRCRCPIAMRCSTGSCRSARMPR